MIKDLFNDRHRFQYVLELNFNERIRLSYHYWSIVNCSDLDMSLGHVRERERERCV